MRLGIFEWIFVILTGNIFLLMSTFEAADYPIAASQLLQIYVYGTIFLFIGVLVLKYIEWEIKK